MNAPSFNLHTGDAVRVGTDWWEVLHRSRNEVALRLSGTFTTRTFSNGELIDAYFKNEIEILRKALAAGLPKGVDEMIARTFETIPRQWQEEALRRLDFVEITHRIFKRFRGKPGWAMRPGRGEGYEKAALLAARMRQKRQADRLGIRRSEVGEEKVGASTLRAWYTRWRKAGYALGALVPLHEKKGASAPRLDEIVVRIIADVVRSRYMTLERLPLRMVYQLICAELIKKNAELQQADPSFEALALPSEMAVRRWIKAYLTPYEITLAREGKRVADHRFKLAKPGPTAIRPLEVVEIDSTLLDVLVISPGEGNRNAPLKERRTERVWLTLGICRATRMVFGWAFSRDKPDWSAIMDMLRMGVQPKELDGAELKTAWPVLGVPEVLVLDNAKEFHSHSMRAAAGQLLMELRYTPRRKPWLKGRVERFFREVSSDFVAPMPGRTFNNVVKKGDYDSKGLAIMSQEKLEELFKIWVVDLYHNRPHAGLLGKTPLQAWEDLSGFGVRVPPKASDLDSLIGLVVQRTIQRRGIEFMGLIYSSPELVQLKRRGGHMGRQYLIKIDPLDLTVILVLDEKGKQWVPIPCLKAAEVQHINLAVWKEVVRIARAKTAADQRVAWETLHETRLRIEEELTALAGTMSAEDRQRHKLLRRQSKKDYEAILADVEFVNFSVAVVPGAPVQFDDVPEDLEVIEMIPLKPVSKAGGVPLEERDPEAHREETLRQTAAISEDSKRREREMREATALAEEHLNSAGKLPAPAAPIVQPAARAAPPRGVVDYDDIANFMDDE
jgi:putative transposase